jgi:kynurenine 3-monooxygenase
VWRFSEILAGLQLQSMSESDTITIVGAGLAGALLACYLGKSGRRVDLYEKRPDPRTGPVERGRSINLALSTRGLHALAEIGLDEEVIRQAIPMRGRMIHHLDGSLAFQPYGKDDNEVLHSVSRGNLNRLLVEAAARYPGVRMFFEHRCVDANLSQGALEFHRGLSQENQKVLASVIVGADGAYSAVRQAMQKFERFDYSQEYLDHGYKEVTIPAGADGAFQLDKNALHIWPRGHFMMIALPNADGSFTCTLFWPFEGPDSFAGLTSEKDILAFFRKQFPDAVTAIPNLADDFLHNPTGPLVTIRCRPWHIGGKVVLLGDACHAVVPFLGQGMNAAFEDCSVLMSCLSQESDLSLAFSDYESKRKPHLDTLAALCIDNFLEMRDRVGSRWFVWTKRLSILLHALAPGWYRPLYTMVEFTRIPYADAVRRARLQDRVAAGLAGVLLAGLGFLIWWVSR